MFWNIVHIPKWKWIDPKNFQAWASEELPTHLQVSYKTKLRYETFEMPSKKVLHFNSNFHFGLVNTFSKHPNIPLKKNWR
jgi:hypothetical protein